MEKPDRLRGLRKPLSMTSVIKAVQDRLRTRPCITRQGCQMSFTEFITFAKCARLRPPAVIDAFTEAWAKAQAKYGDDAYPDVMSEEQWRDKLQLCEDLLYDLEAKKI